MLSASTQLQKALKEGQVLYSKPRVIAEWNHNRYTPIAKVDNHNFPEADNGYDLDVFPIESITEPLRPTAGLLKGRAGEGAVVQGYADTPSGYRTYTVDPDAKYKYWTGPAQATDATYANGGGYWLPMQVKPYVTYSQNAYTNKLYICIENSWANPKVWDIQITTDGTNWTTVASNLVPNDKGQVILYRQANGTWGTNVYRDNPMNIKGIKLYVSSMARKHSWFNLIELGARLERDLSSYVVDYSVKHEIGDNDFISPLGVVSSNTGNVTLSNIDGIFNQDNPDSIYKGLIDANVKFTIDVGIDTSNWGGTGYEYIRQATMYAESWSGGGEESVTVNLKDASKFLQEITPLPELMENVSIGMAIWRILDSVGFIDYNYARTAEFASQKIKYYWTSESQTVWEHISELCRTTQSAAYFDEHGILQIKTRSDAFSKTAPVAWTLDYAKNGTKQPDIIDVNIGSQYEANKVTVKYQTTKLAEDSQGRPISEIIWQPEGTVALRSTGLAADMTKTDMRFWIDKRHAPMWPYEGICNIRGELIKYKGKGYRYYPKGGTYTGDIDKDTVFKVIYTTDEKLEIDNKLSNPSHSWRNYFTGYMKVVERGWDDTTAQAHDVTIAAWRENGGWWGTTSGTQRRWNGGIKHYPAENILRLQTNKHFKNPGYWYTVKRTGVGNETMKYWGTRVRFPKAGRGKQQMAGIWMWGNASQNVMYAIDIHTTRTVDRKKANEIRVLKRKDGKYSHVGGGKGAAFAVNENTWYDIDVAMTSGNFTVTVNGKLVLKVSDSNATQLTETGSCGIYVRGNTVADFEYFYGLADGAVQETDLDNSSYLDIIRGGYYSNQFYKDNAYRVRTYRKRRGKKTTTYKQWYDRRFFDEFGLQVHEVRPYEITFEKFPAIYSNLYVSNEDQTVVDEYIHNPFGAKFIIANASPDDAIVNGEDTKTYGKDNPVNHKLLITGRTIQRAEPKEYVVQNEQAIRARGEIALEFNSDWIQSESAAKALGDWVVDMWSDPCDEVEISVFGNPLFQIGDIVAVNYPPGDMDAATHKYWVTAVDQDWDNGPNTSLSLRRARVLIPAEF
jgi:hypothetical protein